MIQILQVSNLIVTKYAFKVMGPWDADDGRSKTKLNKNEETKGNRSPDSFTAVFLTLVTVRNQLSAIRPRSLTYGCCGIVDWMV